MKAGTKKRCVGKRRGGDESIERIRGTEELY
jgi:hypothetical protein